MNGRARPVLVAIAGGSASGKTTLVEALSTYLRPARVSLLHQDDYYLDHPGLSLAERSRLNFDHPAAIDNGLLARHLRALGSGRPVDSPCYSFRTHARLPRTRRVEPTPLVVVEGIHLLSVGALRRLFDMKLFVDAPPDVRLIRRLRRDTGPERRRALRSVLDQWVANVAPMHARYVEPSRIHADLVVTDASDPRQIRRVLRLVESRFRQARAHRGAKDACVRCRRDQ
jgi:uridine kinase